MSPIVTAILTLLQYAPAAVTDITALYNTIKSDLSSDDQASIDGALSAAQSQDMQATATADAALTIAANS